MFATLTRPYKERSAEETVVRIREILQRYDLLPNETDPTNPFPEIHSITLQLGPDRGGFKAHGKGRTIAYCKASAYAEFVERLQNGLYATYSRTLLSQLREELGFFYDPRERFMSREALLRLPEPVLGDLIRWTGMSRQEFVEAYFDRVAAHALPGVVAVPFFCSEDSRAHYLPLNLLLMAVGSNGMAAGNTLNEAIYQAICELMERWAAAQVFYRQLTPPTVPADWLRRFPEEYAVIRSVEQSGRFKVLVKDFSAGVGIPAIGLMILDPERQTYRLNVGCDTSFQVALSRCLTEVFQGVPNDEAFASCMLGIPAEELECFTRDDDAALNLRQAIFAQFTINNSGVFPRSLFGETESYAFDPGVFATRESYADEVARLIEVFRRQGRPVYIRPVSYLGFPSVFVYIPEVSAMGRKNAPAVRQHGVFESIEWDKIEPQVRNLRTLSPEESLDLATRLQTLPQQMSLTDLMSLKLKPTSVWSQVPVAFVLTLLWYREGRFDEALSAFRMFHQSRTDHSEYYRIVERYLVLRADGLSAEAAGTELLRVESADNIAREVIADLACPSEVFRHLRLPECPDCGGCAISADCLTRPLMDVSRALSPAMKSYRAEMPFPSGVSARGIA